MAKPKGGLGRGLESLFSNSPENETLNDRLSSVPINDIKLGRYQARQEMDATALQELADSIKAQGVIQPIIVREHGLSQYELIAGERRWRAAQLAGLTEIPVVVKNINDKDTLAMGLIENMQRENLNPIEEAQGLKRLVDEFELTHDNLSQVLGKSRSAITNSLRLLKLPEPIQDMLFKGLLEMGHARALLVLPVTEQLELAHQAVKFAWSVREVEKRAQASQIGKKAPPIKKIHPDVVRLNKQLTEQLGANCEIITRDCKKGKVVLHFADADAFSALLERLGIQNDE